MMLIQPKSQVQVPVIWPEALMGLVLIVVNVLINLYPPLGQARGQLMAIFSLVGTLVIGGQLALRFKSMADTPFLKMPLFGPIWQLFGSRKFMVALSTLLATMLVAQIPELAPVQGELIVVFGVIGSTLVWSIAHEDKNKQTSMTVTTSTPTSDAAPTRLALPDSEYERLFNALLGALRVEFAKQLGAVSGTDGPAG